MTKDIKICYNQFLNIQNNYSMNDESYRLDLTNISLNKIFKKFIKSLTIFL